MRNEERTKGGKGRKEWKEKQGCGMGPRRLPGAWAGNEPHQHSLTAAMGVLRSGGVDPI